MGKETRGCAGPHCHHLEWYEDIRAEVIRLKAALREIATKFVCEDATESDDDRDVYVCECNGTCGPSLAKLALDGDSMRPAESKPVVTLDLKDCPHCGAVLHSSERACEFCGGSTMVTESGEK